jgi:hypothetical protein
MAEIVLTDALVKVGSSVSPTTTLWKHVRSVAITYTAELHDKTAMGGDGFRARIAGLKDWNATVEFNQDFANALVEETLWNLVGVASSACWISIKPTSAAAAAGNPRYYGRCCLEGVPVGGGVGELAVASATFQGNGILTRAESS